MASVLYAFTRDTVCRTHYLFNKAISFIKSAELTDIGNDPLQKNDISDARSDILDFLQTKSKNCFGKFVGMGHGKICRSMILRVPCQKKFHEKSGSQLGYGSHPTNSLAKTLFSF